MALLKGLKTFSVSWLLIFFIGCSLLDYENLERKIDYLTSDVSEIKKNQTEVMKAIHERKPEIQTNTPFLLLQPVIEDMKSLPQSPSHLYKKASEELEKGNNDAAISNFTNFILDYPSSEFAHNVQYWIGESYYRKGDYATAYEKFQKVVDYFPLGNKAPDAYLKIALCYTRISKEEDAKKAVSALRDLFPDSDTVQRVSEVFSDYK